jgi:hypothetical protein
MMDLQTALRAKYGRVKKGRSRNGTEYKICCPFCPSRRGKPDHDFKLWINPQKDAYRCWKCDYRGRGIKKLIDGQLVIPESAAPPTPEPVGPVELRDQVMSVEFADDHNNGLLYLQERGFDARVVAHNLKVQYVTRGKAISSPEKGLYFNPTGSIMFPVIWGGDMIGWQYRLTYDPDKLSDHDCEMYGFPREPESGKIIRPPKYFTSFGLPKGEILYNGDEAIKSEIVVVTEGALDVAAVGVPAVALFGKSPTPTQVDLLRDPRWKLRVLMLDPDARRDIDNLMTDLMVRSMPPAPTIAVFLPDKKDPGDTATKVIWREIILEMQRNKLNLADYHVPQLTPYPRNV